MNTLLEACSCVFMPDPHKKQRNKPAKKVIQKKWKVLADSSQACILNTHEHDSTIRQDSW